MKELSERIVTDRDEVEYLEADPSEEKLAWKCTTKNLWGMTSSRKTFFNVRSQIKWYHQGYTGCCEGNHFFDPVDHMHTLKTAKTIFLFCM